MEETKKTNRHHSAKTLFWYFSLFWTMGITAFSIGAVWFQVINKFFPKEINPYYVVSNSFSESAVKGAIAALIVGAPVFFLFASLIRKSINKGLIKLKRGPRQWVGYLILFIVVAIAIGDIIATVLAFLNGDFTARFILKSLTILIITGWIFSYFWTSLRSEKALAGSKLPKITMTASAVLVVVTLIAGFLLIDSPSVSRNKAHDRQRLSDMQSIQYTIGSYYTRFEKLPETLDENSITISQIPVDPETRQPYEYEIINETEYKLCAVFNTSNKEIANQQRYYESALVHEIGKNCFSLMADEHEFAKPLPIIEREIIN